MRYEVLLFKKMKIIGTVPLFRIPVRYQYIFYFYLLLRTDSLFAGLCIRTKLERKLVPGTVKIDIHIKVRIKNVHDIQRVRSPVLGICQLMC